RARMFAPQAVFVNWMGDYWPRLYTVPENVRLLRQYDLTLASNLWGVEQLCRQGVCAAHMAHSFEPVTPDLTQPDYDVVYSGHGYTDFIEALVKELRGLPYRTGIYGRFKAVVADGYSHYSHAMQQEICAIAKVAVSPMEFQDGTAKGYVSNRLWEIMAAGGAV